MKSFLKTFFAALLALITFCVLLFFFFAGVLGSLMQSKEQPEVHENTVLKIALGTPIQEQSHIDPMNLILQRDHFEVQGLHNLIKGIRNAKNDSGIRGIYLKLNGNANLYATNEELRRALLEFKKAGKFIVAYGDVITQKDYYIASVADNLFLNPSGLLDFRGFSMTMMFFKGTMDKLDIKANIFYDGKFKSATEPFRTTEMTKANKIQTRAYLNSLYNHYLSGISAQRHIDTSILFKYADQGLVRSPNDALDYGLVDGLKYKDEVMAVLKKKLGVSRSEDVDFVSLSEYSQHDPVLYAGDFDNEIAILYAQGGIVNRESQGNSPQIVASKYVKLFKKIREDSSIKAVVFRVNSPGGSALASDEIWRALMLTKQVKPVVVSMGDYAASGGYYISCAADRIYTEPNTLTGSIGVFGIIPDLHSFFENKLGVTFDGVKTAKYADIGSAVRPMTAAEKKMIQNQVDHTYGIFKKRVSEGRNLKETFVDSIAQGRVWSGLDAVRLGLADSLGGIKMAISGAARMAHLSDYSLVTYPQQEVPYKQILESINGGIHASLMEEKMGKFFPVFKALNKITSSQGKIMTRLPFALYRY